MSRTIDSTNDFQSFQDDASPARQVLEALRGKSVCPFCGAVSESNDGACGRCTMENSPLTRQATKARLGPWYVLQSRNPSAPGMKYSVLLSLVKKGQITPRSIVRGPTTNQFWRFAARVRGLSREFGICWGCGQGIEPSASICPACQRNQEPPAQPDQLLDSRQPLSQVLPVRREVRPSFESSRGAAREAAAQETMHPQRQRVQLPGPQREPGLDELAAQESAEQRLMMQRRLPSRPPVLQQDLAGRPMAYPGLEPQQPLGRVLLLLGLMAVFTVAGWLYVDIHSREKFFGWARTTWQDLMGDKPAPVRSGRPALAVPDRVPEALIIEEPPAVSRTAPARPETPAQQPAAAAPAPQEPLAVVVEPPPAPAAVPAAPEVAPAPVEPVKADPPAPASEPQVEVAVGAGPGNAAASSEPRVEVRAPVAPAPEPAPDASVNVAVTDPNEAIRTSRKLWREAIDAEARGDWPAAVKLYEQIKRLPADAWPSGIDNRLAFARKRAQ